MTDIFFVLPQVLWILSAENHTFLFHFYCVHYVDFFERIHITSVNCQWGWEKNFSKVFVFTASYMIFLWMRLLKSIAGQEINLLRRRKSLSDKLFSALVIGLPCYKSIWQNRKNMLQWITENKNKTGMTLKFKNIFFISLASLNAKERAGTAEATIFSNSHISCAVFTLNESEWKIKNGSVIKERK